MFVIGSFKKTKFMTDEEYYNKGEKLISKINNVVYSFADIAQICSILLIPISIFRSKILLYVLGSIITICIFMIFMYKFYFHLRHYKFYKKKSQMDRLNWHYPFTKLQWEIRKINIKATYFTFILLGISIIVFGSFMYVNIIFYKVIAAALSFSLGIIILTYLLNFKVYREISRQRKILTKERKKELLKSQQELEQFLS